MIEAEELTKVYGSVLAVDRASFHVKKGETLGLIGTSGCGKTTTLKMLNRLVEPTEGRILIEGRDVRAERPVALRRRIGYVIQEVGLFPHYTVEQNVSVVPELLGWDAQRTAGRVRELLELVGLDPGDYLKRKPHELSGGQKQRIGLARALGADPPIVLLDEPFGALDPISRRQLQSEFKSLRRRLAKTMVMVTHDIFEAFDLCDRICLMDAGRIRQTGTPEELLFHPQDDFVSHFLSTNRLQLAMHVVTLGRLVRDLQGDTPVHGPVHAFSVGTSMAEVMEKLEACGHESCAVEISDSPGGAAARADAGAVLAAFYRFMKEKKA